MSQYLRAKAAAEFRKRKRTVEERKKVMTNAERMKQYRLRKKSKKTGVFNEANDDTVAGIVLEPIPGRSTDPVRFVAVSIGDTSQHDDISYSAALRIKSRPAVYSRPGILHPDWTPISKRSVNVKLSGIIKCKRIQFPLTSACALTVHKSQGGTFPEIVYHYDKGQDQQLVYVGMSRVTSLQGLYLTNTTNTFKFHHAKGSNSPKMVDLRNELQRLGNHRLRTLGDELCEAVANSGSASTLMSINVQSLNAHAMDIATDRILTSVDFLALSETWLDNNSSVEIEGYSCIIQNKRSATRAGGVAIFQKNSSFAMAVPHSIQQLSEEYDGMLSVADSYGDICAAMVKVMDIEVLLVSVYISPSTATKDIEWFMTRNLFSYAREEMPMVVTGDFNIDVSRQDNIKFLDFMKNFLNLKLVNDPKQATTLGGSCIDLTFTKNISAECRLYCAYFSYHRPMLSVLKVEEPEPSNI